MFARINSCFFLLCLFCFSLSLLNGCTGKAGGGQGGAAGAPKTEVIVDCVAQDDVQIYIYTDGRTTPSNMVEIRTRVSGFLEKLFFKPGAMVKAGDPLVLVEQATYEVALAAAKAELANAKAKAALAEANLGRSKILVESRSISPAEFQADQANYDVALAAIELASANVRNAELNLQYTEMRSPITGKTTKNLVDIGNYISPSGLQAVILSVVQLDPMYVEFKISDRQFTDLKDRSGFRESFDKAMQENGDTDHAAPQLPPALTGTPVDVSLMTGMNILDFNFNVPGKVVALVDNRFDFATGQLTLRAEVRNPLLKTDSAEDYMIYADQVCRVRIPYEQVKGAILIREEAILTDLDTKYVLIVAKGMFQPKDAFGRPLKDKDDQEIQPYETDIVYRRDIKMGRLLDTQMRIVLDGLSPGESYIVHGVQRVRIGSEVQPTTLADYKLRRAAETEKTNGKAKQKEEAESGKKH